MGRRKADIPKPNFYLASSKKDNEAVLYVRYHVNGDYVKRSLDIRVQLKDWDKKNHRVKSTDRNFTRKNNQIQTYIAKYDEEFRRCEVPLTKKVIAEILDGTYEKLEGRAKKISFIQYAHDYNDSLRNSKKASYSTWYNKKCSINAFAKFVDVFLKIPFLSLADLKLEYFDRYIEYRLNVLKNKSRVGINKTLVPLYQAIDYAEKNELVSKKLSTSIINNFLPIRETDYNPEIEEKAVKYLTPDQMTDLGLYWSDCNRKRTRDFISVFMFSFYACGLRLSDLITLEWDNIDFENKLITKRQVKTKNAVDIPLTPMAIQILNDWKNEKRNSRFVFDFLGEDFDLSDQRALMMRRNSISKLINASLKSIAKKLSIDNLFIHMARHTFAVMAIQNGLPLHIISRLMGHASVVATEKTYAEILTSTLQGEEVLKKITFTFPSPPSCNE